MDQLRIGWELTLLSGWSLTAFAFLVLTWHRIGSLDADQTASHASSEDETLAEADLVLVTASTISLIGVAFGLAKAAELVGWRELLMTIICVLTVALSWAAVHTVFTLRYAYEYFQVGGGVDFGPDAPTFSDFAYLAFTIGMTYQVSDTPLSDKLIRRTATRHALVSFVFGTAIVATTINVVAGLVNS